MHRHHRNSEPESPKAAFLSGVFAVAFGLFWTVMAGSIFPPMAIFGILWTAIAAVKLKENYKQSKEAEEYNEIQEEKPEEPAAPKEIRCPYCGAPVRPGNKKCEYCDSEF